jgi:hypothetical protein
MQKKKKKFHHAAKKTVESHRQAKMMFSASVSSGLLQKTNTLSGMARKKQQEENWKISRCGKFHDAAEKNKISQCKQEKLWHLAKGK